KIFEILDRIEPATRAMLFRYYKENSKVERLEKEFAAASGARYALAVNSGTSALIAALVACGIGPGDEVIVPAYTFFASASAVVVARAIPVIAEIDETLTIDLTDVERKITKQTRAILPVHMRGLPCKMDALLALARQHNLKVIEDVAQAAGGTYRGQWLGTWGDAGCFSFDFYKILASGEGGMVTTNDEAIYIRAQSYHDTAACWRPNRYARERMPGELFCGENYRMSEVHGAIALAQLRKLNSYLSSLRKNKKALAERLSGLKNLRLAPVHDSAGDCATSLILLAPDPGTARKVISTVKGTGGIYDQTVRDWHIYRYWEHILEKKTPTSEGCPYTCPFYRGRLPDYHPDMCPRTIDILSRVVCVGISEKWNQPEIDELAGQLLNLDRTL
ncbi:MAG TPA: DegT/DnrJ/EryC1/StrS family aminotransferase, partial [bacterium]|nr:DegT/DnrJ/EryC1/StrS family aminotransferase [bacterium]